MGGLAFRARNDKGFVDCFIIDHYQLLLSLLSDEDFPFALPRACDAVRVADCLPEVILVPTPPAHPAVPEVLAHFDVDFVDIERQQRDSLLFVMNFIYMNVPSRSAKVAGVGGDGYRRLGKAQVGGSIPPCGSMGFFAFFRILTTLELLSTPRRFPAVAALTALSSRARKTYHIRPPSGPQCARGVGEA